MWAITHEILVYRCFSSLATSHECTRQQGKSSTECDAILFATDFCDALNELIYEICPVFVCVLNVEPSRFPTQAETKCEYSFIHIGVWPLTHLAANNN